MNSIIRPTKVLIVHANAGGGHRAFKENLLRTLESHKNIEIKVYDTDVTFYESSYKKAQLIPGFWNLTRKLANTKIGYQLLKPLAILPDIQNAEKVLEEFNPDILITTNPLSSVVYFKMKKDYGLGFKLVTSVLDYGEQQTYLHVDEPADGYLVRDDFSKNILKKYVNEEKLHVFGTTVHPAFIEASKLNKESCTERFNEFFHSNFKDKKLEDRSNVLIMGGAHWAYKAKSLIKELSRLNQYNIFVNCGNDKSFLIKLGKYENVFPFRFQSQETLAVIERFVDVTILSSIAPATMHELLTINKYPLFVHSIIKGQESPHIPLLKDWNIGVYEPDTKKMIELINEFLQDQNRYSSMLESGRKIREEEEKKAEDNYKIIESISSLT